LTAQEYVPYRLANTRKEQTDGRAGTAPDGEAVPDWEAAADEAIGLCGGDARATVIALLHMNNALEHEIALMRGAMSFGYSRGCFHKGGSDVETQG